jgi:ribosomal protein S18 acetylase RimI-like enzyme
MSVFELRPALVSDSAGIAAVHVETWQDAYKGLLPDGYLSALNAADRTKTWIENLGNSRSKTKTFVALDAENTVGFIRVGACEDESESTSTGEIWALYVHPTRQGMGIGSLLMTEGVRALRTVGFEEVVLWVLNDNLTARNWYESRGWGLNGKTKTEITGGFTSTLVGYSMPLSKEIGTT